MTKRPRHPKQGSGMGKADGGASMGDMVAVGFPSDHFAVLAILQYRDDPSRLVKRSSLDTNPRAARHELTTAIVCSYLVRVMCCLVYPIVCI